MSPWGFLAGEGLSFPARVASNGVVVLALSIGARMGCVTRVVELGVRMGSAAMVDVVAVV